MDEETLNSIFRESVKEKIWDFNKTRGKRKELNPNIVETIPQSYRKFGRILDCDDNKISELSPEIVFSMAGAVVRTLLQRKPRPHEINVIIGKSRYKNKYLFRLLVSKKIIT